MLALWFKYFIIIAIIIVIKIYGVAYH